MRLESPIRVSRHRSRWISPDGSARRHQGYVGHASFALSTILLGPSSVGSREVALTTAIPETVSASASGTFGTTGSDGSDPRSRRDERLLQSKGDDPQATAARGPAARYECTLRSSCR